MSGSLYDQLGGFSFVRKLVSDFYDRVLDEEDLVPFFEEVDMGRLVDHQTKFWATVLGGPASYTPEQLKVIHGSKEIADQNFDLVLKLIRETLEDHEVGEQRVDIITEALDAYRSVIVCGNDSDG